MDDRDPIFIPQLPLKKVQCPTFNQTDIQSFATQRGLFFGALVEETSITSANVNDGKAELEALPDNLGEVLSDRAIAAITFAMPYGRRSAYAAVSPLACGSTTNRKRFASFTNRTSRSIACAVGLRRSSKHKSAAMACAERYCELSPSHRPSPPHRNRLQSQAHLEHSRDPDKLTSGADEPHGQPLSAP